MFIAGVFADRFGLEEKREIEMAALLHDIGHLPFSHSFEDYFGNLTGMSHEEAGIRMIAGKKPFHDSDLPGILENLDVDIATVTGILGKKRDVDRISGIVSGPVDSDELDYLRRDAYYCGVQVGSIDYRRVINTVVMKDGKIVIEEKGVPSMEILSVSRIQMYRSVYWHKTCRIAQGMIRNALELLETPPENPFSMRDDELFSLLLADRRSSGIARDVMNRRIYKVYGKYPYSPENIARIKEILQRSGIESREYVLDVIPPEYFRGSERVKSNITVLKDGKEYQISDESPLIRSLEATLESRFIILSASSEGRQKMPESLAEDKFRQASS